MRGFLLRLTDIVTQHSDSLNRMDAECGDGDFGVGMQLGFKNVRRALLESKNDDIASLLKAAGQQILSSAGGASGPLFGTLFIEAGKAVEGKQEIDVLDLARMFENSLERIRLRGGASVGDKTLVDALAPAATSLRRSAENGVDLSHALETAAEAAETGATSTKNLIAKHGKARYLGEQALGCEDPGAEVVRLIFETLSNHYRIHSCPGQGY
jgi:dihydroxyacetone kinase-like protein